MYQTHGALHRRILASFPENSDAKPNCAWYNTTGGWRVGAVNGAVWKQVEAAWGHDTYGNWTGSPPTLVEPSNLRLLGSTGIPIEPEWIDGFLKLSRIAAGVPLRVFWERVTLTKPGGVPDALGAFLQLYSASTGDVVAHGNGSGLPWIAGTGGVTIQPSAAQTNGLKPGSYALHIAYTGVVEGLRIPPGAVRQSIYDYTTGDNRLSHYNPDENWGEVPASETHPLRLLRIQLVQANQNHDVEAYSVYLTSESPRDGEGAMLLVQVGSGDWTLGAGVLPSPAKPLFKLQGSPDSVAEFSTKLPILCTPTASQVTTQLRLSDGRQLLGGALMDENGTHPAIWEWVEGEGAQLIGAATDSCGSLCEQLLSTGGVTGLAELVSGDIIVLTLCSRYRLAGFKVGVGSTGSFANGAGRTLSLVRYPAIQDGEPGGRSLVSSDNRVLHLTEALGLQPDPETPSFYNVGVDILGDQLLYFPGTVAEVDSALWTGRGKVWGVRANGSLVNQDPEADPSKVYITFYDGSWNKGVQGWRSDWMILSRGISLNGRTLAFGWKPSSLSDGTEGRVVRNNGFSEQVITFDHRIRHISITDTDNTRDRQLGESLATTIGRVGAQGNWHVLALDGYLDGECHNLEVELTKVGSIYQPTVSMDTSLLPTYIYLDSLTHLWASGTIAPGGATILLQKIGGHYEIQTGSTSATGFLLEVCAGRVHPIPTGTDETTPHYRILGLMELCSVIQVKDCSTGRWLTAAQLRTHRALEYRVDEAGEWKSCEIGRSQALVPEAQHIVEVRSWWPATATDIEIPLVGKRA